MARDRSTGKGRKGHSLRFNLSLYFTLISLICILLLAAVFALFLWRRNAREIENQRAQLVEQGKEMAHDLERLLRLERTVRQDREILRRSSFLILLEVEGRLINALPVLADEEGRIVEPTAMAARLLNPIPEKMRTDGEVRVVEEDVEPLGKVMVVGVPLQVESGEINSLYLFKKIKDLGGETSGDLYLYLALASVVALIISLSLAVAFSRQIARPVRELTMAVQDVAHGDLEKRIEVEGSKEIAELSETFNYMTSRIKEGIDQQREFVANVSHELRTPLTSIEGFSQAVLEGVVKDEGQKRRYLEVINLESKRLVRILRDLLTLSRLDAGEIDIRPTTLDISSFLREMQERFIPLSQEKGVEFELEISSGLPSMVVDRDKLEQVMINLIDNAIKYTESGGKVLVSATRKGTNQVVLQVRDTGVGIPPEDLPHVFDRFFRVERSRAIKYGGAGLGLSICKQLVEAMGGSIQVQSAHGVGTVFTITLSI
jgi:signal transduction histidine kinase